MLRQIKQPVHKSDSLRQLEQIEHLKKLEQSIQSLNYERDDNLENDSNSDSKRSDIWGDEEDYNYDQPYENNSKCIIMVDNDCKSNNDDIFDQVIGCYEESKNSNIDVVEDIKVQNDAKTEDSTLKKKKKKKNKHVQHTPYEEDEYDMEYDDRYDKYYD